MLARTRAKRRHAQTYPHLCERTAAYFCVSSFVKLTGASEFETHVGCKHGDEKTADGAEESASGEHLGYTPYGMLLGKERRSRGRLRK